MNIQNEYWLKKDAEDIAQLRESGRSKYSMWSNHPVEEAWVRNTIAYYSNLLTPQNWETSLAFEGEQGELVRMLVPQARKLVKQLTSIITKQRLNFNSIAESKNSKVIRETRLSNALAAQIVDDEGFDLKLEEAVERAFVHGMSFSKSIWRTDQGGEINVKKDGSLLYEGDLEFEILSVFDVSYDYNVQRHCNRDWFECRVKRNKWNLIAQYPELEQEILALEPCDNMDIGMDGYLDKQTDYNKDNVYVYELYVKPMPALPEGRILIYSDPYTVFYDGDNIYNKIPVEELKPEVIFGMGSGYPLLSNLLPAQEMLDTCFSSIATNQEFAVQSITVAKGSGINVQDIAGRSFIEYKPQNVPGGGKPEPLQLTQSSPETFKFIETLSNYMQELSDIVGAMRGVPPPGVTSGTAIATVTANALEFISSAAKHYAVFAEKSMMNCITAFKVGATSERIVRVGVGNSYMFEDFSGKDLESIKLVKLTLANPLMMTAGGRTDVAEKALSGGLVKNIQEYFSILEGAPTSELWQTELSENDLVEGENEKLVKGESCPVLATDNHSVHFYGHKALLNDPDLRGDPEKIALVLEHIDQHIRLIKETDPTIRALVETGQAPPPGPPPGEAPGLPAGAELPPAPGQQPVAPVGGQGVMGNVGQEIAQPAQDSLGRMI